MRITVEESFDWFLVFNEVSHWPDSGKEYHQPELYPPCFVNKLHGSCIQTFRQTLVRHDTRPGPAVSNIPWDEWREHEEHISKVSNEDPLDTNPMCILL